MVRSCVQDEGDVYYDSVESFRSCGSVSAAEGVELDYRIWESEPVSIRERRERFLRGMGLDEGKVDRIGDCTGAVSSTWCPVVDREGHPSCSGRELDEETKFCEPEQYLCSRQVAGFAPEKVTGVLPIAQQLTAREATATVQCEERRDQHTIRKKNIKAWWNHFVQKRMKEGMHNQSGSIKDHKENRMKVGRSGKSCMEFTAVYMKQQIQGHKGFIWTMKFSPDGRYLASGGEDGVVRVWRVTSTVASCECITGNDTSVLSHEERGRKLIPRRNKSKPASVIIPRKIFGIDESPLHEFHGHTDDVLDLCWSKSNCLLSASKDETVRLWRVGTDECLRVFNHNNYVTCIQFNPIDDGYFISGSIDGKVRVWGVSERRVVDWADVRDIITAICYQPDGQGFVVGSISGHCRFYDASGHNLQLDAQICVQGKKKSSSNRITGLQFSPEDAQKVMITSADSKVRIFDGLEVIHKYRGLRKSGSQMSASFTPNGRHIISVGEDSRVYVWNYDGLGTASPKHRKSIRSCEHFFSEGVSVAVPWLGMEHDQKNPKLRGSLDAVDPLVTSSLMKDSARFSLGGWFSKDGRLSGLATWPEEKLPLWSGTVPEQEDDYHEGRDHEHSYHHEDHHQQEKHHHPHKHNHSALCSTWGLVIVTAGWDGMIRTFHNYGLPVRL